MVPVAATVVVIAAFQIPAFTERQNLGAVTLLLVLFGSVTLKKSRFTNCSHIVVVLECILLTKMYLIMNQSFVWLKILKDNLLEIVLSTVAILLDCFPL